MKYRKIVGKGNTATVYEWKEDKVLKLFRSGYPKEDVEKEFHNAKAISTLNFIKPKAYEIVSYEERIGIVYDRVQGESLLDWVIKSRDVQGCSAYMAKLHKDILSNTISNVLNYKKFLASNISKATSIPAAKRTEALQLLDKLQDGYLLCHGDFHPGNIFISDGQVIAIDFMNICHGSFLYDIARTVFLVEYTPVSIEEKDREMILQLKKTIVDLYLKKMNVTREMIHDYLIVIMAARKGECPNEHSISIFSP